MGSSLVQTPYGAFSARYKHARLVDLCVEKSGVQTGPFGSQLHQHDYVLVGTPIITVEHLGENRILHKSLPRVSDEDRERLCRYSLKPGDIVFSRVGSVDLRALVREEESGWLFSGRCLRVRPEQKLIDPAWLSWFFGLPSFREHVRKIAVGATMPSLNTKILSDLPIFLPPLPEQKAIASILGALDDKIELNRKMNETLETMARAIFKSWFVDFDPIPGLGPHKEWQDSPIGRIPKGWSVVPLPEGIEVNPSRALRKGAIAPYLDMANMPTHSARAMEVYGREFGSGMRFIDGDTLVARITPCLENGKTCFVDFLGSGKVGWGSTEYIVLRPKPPMPPEFAYFLSRTEDFRSFAISNMTGSSGRQRVPADAFNHFFMTIPPVEIANKFGLFARTAMNKMKANDEQSRTLASIRDALLPKLLSGEIRVKDVEKIIEGHA